MARSCRDGPDRPDDGAMMTGRTDRTDRTMARSCRDGPEGHRRAPRGASAFASAIPSGARVGGQAP